MDRLPFVRRLVSDTSDNTSANSVKRWASSPNTCGSYSIQPSSWLNRA
jgi:hypothetical protein